MGKPKKSAIFTIIGGAIGAYLLHFPLRLLEDWVMGEIETRIAENFQDILGFFIAWVLPFIIVFGAIWLGYRLKNPKSGLKGKVPTAEQKVPSRREALEMARVAWGLWHTGTRMRIERLLKSESLKRILILEPNVNGESVRVIAQRSGETKEGIITQLHDTTRESLENTKDIRWYTNHRESAFTIYDTTPVKDADGVLKPCSENAWLYVEYLNPEVGVDQRPGGPIYNRGKDKSRFMGFYREYENVWDKESIMAKDINKDINEESEAKRTLIDGLKIKQDTDGAEKVKGLEVENQDIELRNTSVDIRAKNAKEVTGASFKQTNKPALSSYMIICECGERIGRAFTGMPPSTIKCPKCGKEYNVH